MPETPNPRPAPPSPAGERQSTQTQKLEKSKQFTVAHKPLAIEINTEALSNHLLELSRRLDAVEANKGTAAWEDVVMLSQRVKALESILFRQMTPEEQEQQRRSFAFGNVAIDNPSITRADIDAAAERLESSLPTKGQEPSAVGSNDPTLPGGTSKGVGEAPDSSVGAKIIESLTDLRDTLARGEKLEDRYTVRKVAVPAPPVPAGEAEAMRAEAERVAGAALDYVRWYPPYVHTSARLGRKEAVADLIIAFATAQVEPVRAERNKWFEEASDITIECDALRARLAEVERERDAAREILSHVARGRCAWTTVDQIADYVNKASSAAAPPPAAPAPQTADEFEAWLEKRRGEYEHGLPISWAMPAMQTAVTLAREAHTRATDAQRRRDAEIVRMEHERHLPTDMLIRQALARTIEEIRHPSEPSP